MKTALTILFCLLVTPVLARPWQTHKPVTLSPSGTSSTIDIGTEIGPVSEIRMAIDGSTVYLDSLTLNPVNGTAIVLSVPILLKSGEHSGRIKVPGTGVVTESLLLKYHITSGTPAQATIRVR